MKEKSTLLPKEKVSMMRNESQLSDQNHDLNVGSVSSLSKNNSENDLATINAT